jgi:DDE superfamily endonuclease
VRAARAEFRALGLEQLAERLIFLDESGVNLSMTRSCARAARGQRAPGHVPKNWGDSVTLCAGIALRGLVAPLYLHGSMNGEIFEAYVEQFLVGGCSSNATSVEAVVRANIGGAERS